MKKSQPWTTQEQETLLLMREQGAHTTQIAEALSRSDQAIRLKLRALGRSSTNPINQTSATNDLLDSTDQEFEAEDSVENNVYDEIDVDLANDKARLLQAEARRAKEKYADLLREKALEDRLLDIFATRFRAFLPRQVEAKAPPLRTASSRSASAAVLLVSDTHIGQRVYSEQTAGYGTYNPREYCCRLHYLESTVMQVLADAIVKNVDELHIFLLGDIVHGVLRHDAEREPTELIIDQFQLAVYTLHQTLARFATLGLTVYVHCVVGNHGRLPDQRRMPTVNRHSNFDGLVYGALKHSLAAQGINNLVFNLNTAPRQIVNIKGSYVLAFHGDHLRGGDKQMGLPVHSIAREINTVTQRQAAENQHRIDYYICGDKHKHVSLPVGSGNFIINGSFVGVDEFSISFPPVEPIQLLFWLDPLQRKTLELPIKLQFAPQLDEIPYDLPEHIKHLVA